MSTFGLAFTSALVDFVWQGTLVALALLAALHTLGRRSAQIRYGLCLLALAMLMALPVLTTASRLEIEYFLRGAGISDRPITVITDTGKGLRVEALIRSAAAPSVISTLQPWILPIWSLGVLLLSLRLVAGGLEVRALRRTAAAADDALRQRVARLAPRMGFRRSVQVATSPRADGPSVIGWLRPLILLPPATLMGLTTTQLDAVLAHELAHIRRHDYLVNIIQMVAETLLFYHPAVWWVSKRLRSERELCCDDEAVRMSGDATAYARALVTMAKLQVPAMAVGSTGGSLTDRVRRLLGGAGRPEPRRSAALGVLALAVMFVTTVAAQQSLGKGPTFEVASVKRYTSSDRRMSFQVQSGSFVAINVPAALLIQHAYGLSNEGNRIIGAPSWVLSDRFEVTAKLPTGDQRQVPEMVQALLADRFKLVAHKETRPMPVYSLAFVKNGVPGPGLKPTAVDCSAERAGCGTVMDNGFLSGRGATMRQVSNSLSFLTGRTVIDNTNVGQKFDFEIRFSNPRLGVDNDDPPVFTVLPEQLGLKLNSDTQLLEVLVIDHIESPSEN